MNKWGKRDSSSLQKEKKNPENKDKKNDRNQKSPLGNTTVITAAGKNHQWILKLVGESMMRKRIFA